MSDVNNFYMKSSIEHVVQKPGDFGNVAKELYEKALKDAKSELHPLLQITEFDRLAQRAEFLQAFKSALEKRIARTLALWQPGVLAIFKYDEIHLENIQNWDGSIHLLVKVPRLSNAVRALGKKLDRSLVKRLQQLGWQRFKTCQSILEVHQVTPNELRHAVGYGAMFCAVHNVPEKVWTQRGC
jgi:hypothetical protein